MRLTILLLLFATTPLRADLLWFGNADETLSPWCHNQDHGYFYDGGEGCFHLDNLGWIWTADGVWPWFYQYGQARWLYHAEGTAAPGRWFYSPDLEDWLEEAQAPEPDPPIEEVK